MTGKEQAVINALRDDVMRFHLWDIADGVRELAKEVQPIKSMMRGEMQDDVRDDFLCVRMVPGSFNCRRVPEEKLDEVLKRIDRNGGIWFGRILVGYFSKKRVFRIQGRSYLAGPIYLAKYSSAPDDLPEIMRDAAELGRRSVLIEVEGHKIPMFELGDAV